MLSCLEIWSPCLLQSVSIYPAVFLGTFRVAFPLLSSVAFYISFLGFTFPFHNSLTASKDWTVTTDIKIYQKVSS